MSAKSQALQSPFLNALRLQRIPVRIFLGNKIVQHGIIVSFDQHVLIIRFGGVDKMYYKHAIATIVPDRHPEFTPQGEPEEGSEDDVQSAFLSVLKTSGLETKVFLINGIGLIGRIIYYDQFSILFEDFQSVQMIYKHAVSTVGSLK